MLASSGPHPADLVIVAVLDGLRPDAIDAFALPHIQRLREAGAYAPDASTVAPSTTWAAMTSLMTGVAPARHGIVSDLRRLPLGGRGLTLLPRVLADHEWPAVGCLADVPLVYRPVTAAIGRRLGLETIHHGGGSGPEIVLSSRAFLAPSRRGLVVLHLPDADRAGHAEGWMSPAYGAAARQVDAAAGMIASLADIRASPRTLVILLADHGGGGEVATDHESDHPADRTIPLLLLGAGVQPGTIPGTPSLLDVPVTVCRALGVPVPASFEGAALGLGHADGAWAA